MTSSVNPWTKRKSLLERARSVKQLYDSQIFKKENNLILFVFIVCCGLKKWTNCAAVDSEGFFMCTLLMRAIIRNTPLPGYFLHW